MGDTRKQKINQRTLKKEFSIIVIFCLIAFAIGYTVGQASMLGFCVKAGVRLLELENINLTIDENLIKYGISQYTGQFKELLNIT